MKTNTIIKPLITEKTSLLSQNKVYSFVVSDYANKNSITQSIEDMFKVKVNDVNIVVRKGKEKRVGRRMMRKIRPDVKIAYVTLKNGVIDLFPQA